MKDIVFQPLEYSRIFLLDLVYVNNIYNTISPGEYVYECALIKWLALTFKLFTNTINVAVLTVSSIAPQLRRKIQ